MRGLMLLPQREEQLALPPEVVVEAAHAGARPGHDVRDAGLGEALLAEDLAGLAQHVLPRLGGAAPLPGAALPCHRVLASVTAFHCSPSILESDSGAPSARPSAAAGRPERDSRISAGKVTAPFSLNVFRSVSGGSPPAGATHRSTGLGGRDHREPDPAAASRDHRADASPHRPAGHRSGVSRSGPARADGGSGVPLSRPPPAAAVGHGIRSGTGAGMRREKAAVPLGLPRAGSGPPARSARGPVPCHARRGMAGYGTAGRPPRGRGPRGPCVSGQAFPTAGLAYRPRAGPRPPT